MSEEKPDRRSRVDLLAVGARALIARLPGSDSSKEGLFGTMQQKELARLAELIDDVQQQLEGQRAPGTGSEELANLFADLAPDIARVTDKTKRDRFRDLLTHASSLEPGSPDWESAKTAGQWITSLEAPAFQILSYVHRHGQGGAHRPGLPEIAAGIGPYEEDVIEEWLKRLLGMGFLVEEKPDADGPPVFGVSDQGEFMIRWTTSDRTVDAGED